MRLVFSAMALVLALGGCAAPRTWVLSPADAATAMISGDRLTLTRVASETGGGDPLILLTLTHADGRAMRFEEANHAPYDLRAQAAGGPLAQAMGLLGNEQPTLFHARDEVSQSAPFLCAPDGAASIGILEAVDGVRIVGLKQGFEFETAADGAVEALPFSPDQICARLRFRRD
ncbi:MAG: hypothetical protein ABL864_03805 [Terricaulis sp.]